MRRSTKVAMASALGIATLAAQIGPYAVDPFHDSGSDRHRVERTRALLSKLEAGGDDGAGFFRGLLALAAGSRAMSAAADYR